MLLKALQEARREQGCFWAFKAGSVRLERASGPAARPCSVSFTAALCVLTLQLLKFQDISVVQENDSQF